MNRLSLSLSRTLVTPTASTPWCEITRAAFPPCVPSCANPSGQGQAATNSLVGPGTPPGLKHRNGQYNVPRMRPLIFCLDGQEVSNLHKLINYDPYGVKTFGYFGQSHNEIHTNIFPFPSWDGQRLQWSSGLHVHFLDTSTSVTSCHIACNFNLHFFQQ
jgi:hypothetical protein